MLSNILIMSDASEASDHMLDCVKKLRHVGSHDALLVHAMDIENIGGLYATLKSQLAPKLEAQKKSLQQAGFNVSLEIPLGIPYREVNRLAAEHNISAIVVGSHGHTLMQDVMLGSTACALLQNTRFPVLLARLEIINDENGLSCDTACENLFQHILFPTDFSDTAERAFQYLEHIVSETKCQVTLLHVQDKTHFSAEQQQLLHKFDQVDKERLERMQQQLLHRGAAKVDLEILYGSPTEIILQHTRSKEYSLVVMGSQGRGFIAEIFQGSVAHNVARLAPLPVLFIPALR
jgi:nucleotide-binding universal stress UspA family protein